MDSLKRNLAAAALVSLTDSPVVFLQGARQTGKTTLVRSLVSESSGKWPARYYTLDDASVLASVQASPEGFIDGILAAGIECPVIIDEVQRVPELALAIKAAVDRQRTPGRFLLTGSADFLVLLNLADSLAGRIEIHTLWPLSQGEIEGRRESFVDAVFGSRFAPRLSDRKAGGGAELVNRLAQGGYPEMLSRRTEQRRRAWFESYILTILQRDVRDISNVRDLSDMPRLLALAASRAGGLLDYSDLSRGLSMPQTTMKRYMGLLQATFLIHMVPAWAVNFGKRLVKAPKLYLNDTAMLLHLLGVGIQRLQEDPMLMGGVLENFVLMELIKQRGWSEVRPSVHHFRTHNGDEVDCVLEDGGGRIVGIEVKAAASVKATDFKGLRVLAEAAGDRFVRGIVLYTGKEAVPFGKNLVAVPVEALWS